MTTPTGLPHGACALTDSIDIDPQIIKTLIDEEWEFSITWSLGVFSICVWKLGWMLNDLYRAHRWPMGEGRTLEEAFDNIFKERV